VDALAAARDAPFDFESFFLDRYDGIVRVVARVVRDPARAEDIASEAFWKLWRTPRAQGESAGGWLYRTAVRMALDELRRSARRGRSEASADRSAAVANPEQIRTEDQEREQVRRTLAALDARAAELLLLRSHGLSYSEVAAALELNPASVGTLISRAQQAFRKAITYLAHMGQYTVRNVSTDIPMA
jgi:RNA polymerase sigma-70 factor (ECF subfamily)